MAVSVKNALTVSGGARNRRIRRSTEVRGDRRVRVVRRTIDASLRICPDPPSPPRQMPGTASGRGAHHQRGAASSAPTDRANFDRLGYIY